MRLLVHLDSRQFVPVLLLNQSQMRLLIICKVWLCLGILILEGVVVGILIFTAGIPVEFRFFFNNLFKGAAGFANPLMNFR